MNEIGTMPDRSWPSSGHPLLSGSGAISTESSGDWKRGRSFAVLNMFTVASRSGSDAWFDTPITRVELHQHEYQHETCIFYIERNLGQRLAEFICAGQPVSLLFGRRINRYRQWSGYIVAHKIVNDRVIVFAYGPTWRLRQRQTRVWTNASVVGILSRICEQNFLTMHLTRTNALALNGQAVFSTIVQTEAETTWQFMCRIAAQAGLVLVPSTTTIFARPRNLVAARDRDFPLGFGREDIYEAKLLTNTAPADLEQPVATVPGSAGGGATETIGNQPEETSTSLCRAVLRQEEEAAAVQEAQQSPGPYLRPGLDVDISEMTGRQWDPATPAEAERDLDAFRHIHGFPRTALVQLRGDARLIPGDVLLFDNLRGNPMIGGHWYLNYVWHVFINDRPSNSNRDRYMRYFMRCGVGSSYKKTDIPFTRPVRPVLPRNPEDQDDEISPTRPEGSTRPPRPRPPVFVIPFPTRPPLTPPGDIGIIPPGSGVPVVVPSPPPPVVSPTTGSLGPATCPPQARPFLAQEWRSPVPGLFIIDEEVLVAV